MTNIFSRLKYGAIKFLRILLEDKDMRGDRFDDLKCSTSGALSVDIRDIHASETYKKARMQSDRVLGIHSKTKNDNDRVSSVKIDYAGRILLPDFARSRIAQGSEIELAELSNGRILVLLTPHSIITERDQLDK